MTTNSKNSRMRYHGYNNRRLYQMDLDIKREKREMKRDFRRAAKASSNLFVFLIKNIILYFVHENHEAEMEQQAIEKKIVRERQRIKNKPPTMKRKRRNRRKQMH